jgi:hypothetical protein
VHLRGEFGCDGVVTVATARERYPHDSEEQLARQKLWEVIDGDDVSDPPDRSEAGSAILRQTVRRDQERRASEATCAQRTLFVDACPEAFTSVSAERWSAAVRRDGDLLITVSTQDVDLAAVQLHALENALDVLSPGPH